MCVLEWWNDFRGALGLFWPICLKVLLPVCSLSGPSLFHSCVTLGPSHSLNPVSAPLVSLLSLLVLYLVFSGTGPVVRSQPTVRAQPAPELQVAMKGRELRVVVNTNDPDYEHIYSIEAYDEPLDELLLFSPSANQSDGKAVKGETDKKVKVEAKKLAGAAVKRAATFDGQRAVKVTPVKADKLKSVKSKKRVTGKAPADLCLLPMEEGSCGRYTLRWYFNSQVRACRPFIYSGCEGNDNRFLQLEDCEKACLGEVKGPNPLTTAR
ncbi:uncharacterized protein LOC141789628 isoform X2 [Halichoeres trimaculatus]|uniref:uncharacterized protein LOC141789628 isoform X2 n=1 Tax=Halichoeres trimaculatus TaxID=147232 RepID=UPI003D9E8BC1